MSEGLPGGSSAPAEDPFVVHSDGEILYANSPCLTLLGSESPDEVVGHTIFQFIIESDHQSLQNQFYHIISQEADALGIKTTIEPLHRDPHEVVLVTSAVEWNGKTGLQTTFIDISEQLSEEPIFRRAMNAAPVGITIADATHEDEPLIYVSDEFSTLTGYSQDKALGQNCRFLQGPETNQAKVDTMREAIDAEEPVTVILRNYRRDGTMFWNRVTIIPVRDKTGVVTHLLGYQEDVSQMKMYEHEKTLFEKQAEAAPYAMFITNREGVIEYVNPAFERITGYSESEAIGETPRLLKSDQQDEAFYEELWETITAGEIWEEDLINRKKSGELFQVQQTLIPIEDDTGEITHFAAIERDISDTVFTEQVFDVVNRILRHNLRTSINVIDGYTEVLRENIETSTQLTAVNAISDRTDRIERISEKTDEIRKIIEDRNENKLITVEEIHNHIDFIKQSYETAEIRVIRDVADDIAVQNGSLLQLAMKEAIENAVIHKKDGQPRIEITITQPEDETHLCISIADNGSGIPQEEWDVITANQETPLEHASGIGLWLVYWSITALGGSVELTRHGSYGSLLTYRLPIVDTY